MAVLIPDLGLQKLLQMLLTISTGSIPTITFRLFSNDYTPVPGSVEADFTECAFTGYSPLAIGRGDMTVPAPSTGIAQAVYVAGLVTYTATAAFETVYGLYVTSDDDDTVLWAERFATPIDQTTDPEFQILPQLSDATYVLPP